MAPEAIKRLEEIIKNNVQDIKSISQGAATSCWAATSLDLENENGLYLEDCHIAEPLEDDLATRGYAPCAFRIEGAERLWVLSNELLRTEF